MRLKIQLIFLPFLRIAARFILTYTFLDWWLVIRLQVITWDEEAIQIWLPIILLWIPVLIWLRPQMLLLKFTGRRDASGHLLIAAIAIAIPTILLQFYLETATGKLSRLEKISQIGVAAPTKYYMVEQYYAQRELAQVSHYATVSGKGNANLSFTMYVATPLFDKQTVVIKDKGATKVTPKQDTVTYGRLPDSITTEPNPIANTFTPARVRLSADTTKTGVSTGGKTGMAANAGKLTNTSNSEKTKAAAKASILAMTGAPIANIGYGTESTVTVGAIEAGPSQAWLCIKYERNMNNHRSAEEKLRVRSEFLQASQQDYDHLDLNNAVYLDRIGNTHNRKYYGITAEKSFLSSISKAPITILEAHYEPYANRNGHKLEWAMLSFAIGGGLLLLLLRFSPFNEEKLKAKGYELT